jgi:hypothetical protein
MSKNCAGQVQKMVWFDRAAIAFLALGVTGHLMGSLTLTEPGSALQVWSLAGVLCAALVVALNILRHLRPTDAAIAWLAFAASFGWLVIALLFGRSLGNYFDFRVLWHGLGAAMLALISLRAATLAGP